MLRLVFGSLDLQRVRFAGAANPMWELVLGLQKAHRRGVPGVFAGWRQAVGRGIAESPDRLWPLDCLVPARGDFPDFLTPAEPVIDFDVGCEAVAATSRERLMADLAATFRRRAPQPWVRSLATGDRESIGATLRAVRAAYELIVAPVWADAREKVAEDRARRARVLTDEGVGAVMRRIPGVFGWDGSVLRLRYPEARTVHLAGRGLVLLPSYFCWDTPVTWLDPELPPVLVYQARDPAAPVRPNVTVPAGVVALLGATRAECLRLLLTSRSTSEVAEHLGTSVGTASKQTAVLRNAGLITSSRRGTQVLHLITPLGVALLTGQAPGPYM